MISYVRLSSAENNSNDDTENKEEPKTTLSVVMLHLHLETSYVLLKKSSNIHNLATKGARSI